MTSTSSPSAIDVYMAKPYHIRMVRDDSGGPSQWVAGIEELPGCLSQGDSPEEALSMIREAMFLWIEVALEHGDSIPEPSPEDAAYSGKFQVRLPVSLHARLVHEAEREGASLNQFITGVLAAAVNWKGPRDSTMQTDPKPGRRAG